nr:MAG TPA: hypothetical protein [Caudoviricetes sp.]
MAECITKDQVIEWFRPYGHAGDGIPYSWPAKKRRKR